MSTPSDFIKHLNDARRLTLGDPSLYSQVLSGVLGAIGPGAPLVLRRWGAEFLSECFGSPALGSDEKTRLAVQQFPAQEVEGESKSLEVLGIIKDYLENDQDVGILKGAIVTAAAVYPLLVRWIIENPNDSTTWQKVATIKSNILRRMDSAPFGVRVCCIKFVQKVIQTQTPGLIADPRRPEQNEISLALVPRDHPLIPPPNLEAEASGLLDRLLSVLQEDISEAILVTATLNSMGVLIRTRASISSKILSTILNFNPFRLAGGHPVTSKTKVLVKSMERTTRSLLLNTLKRSDADFISPSKHRNSNHPLTQRMQAYLDRLHQNRSEFFDESSRKRPAPTEPIDSLDSTKRARLGAGVPVSGALSPPPLPAGPVSYTQLFTLTHDQGSKSFDVSAIPHELVVKILLALLRRTDQEDLNTAINAVRSRFLSLSARPPPPPLGAPPVQAPGADDEDDDYEPDFEPAEDTEQLLNKLDTASTPLTEHLPLSNLAPIGPYKLPPPPPLTAQEAAEHGKATVGRLLTLINEFDDTTGAGGVASLRNAKNGSAIAKGGFNRLAASSNDRDAWVTVLARLATRTGANVEHFGLGEENGAALVRGSEGAPVADAIRMALFRYVLDDFRRRIGVAIAWLCEEWYNDRVTGLDRGSTSTPNYDSWVLKIMDGMVPYLDARDGKVMIVFLSEVPALSSELLDRVKSLAKDPERVNLAVQALHYLILFRPPVKEMCVECLVDLWKNYSEARNAAAKLLTKWKPEALQQPDPEEEEYDPTEDPIA